MSRTKILPLNWVSTTFEEIGELNPKNNEKQISEDDEVTFLPMTCVSEMSGRIDTSNIRKYGSVKKGYTQFADGDLLFAKITPCMENGKIAIAKDLKNGIGCGSTEFHVIRLSKLVSTQFYFLYLIQSAFRKEAQRSMTGSAGQLRVPKNFLTTIPIPLPPIPEQYRIVAKIEELFTQLDAGVAALTMALAQLKRYRQSVLKAAFEGKLTEEWRERHLAVNLASDYINAQSSNDFKSKKKEESELSQIKNLPKSWIWTNISSIGEVSGGFTKNSKRNFSEIQLPYLRVANVYQNKLDLHDIKNIGVLEQEIDKYRLKKGDLLVVEGNGSIDQIGRVALWDDSISLCLHQNHIIKVRFDPLEIGKYVLYWLLSIDGRENIVRVASSTSGLHTLSISKVSGLPVPFPPYDEQHEIVAEIERRFTIIDETEKTIQQSLTQAERLRQSILKRAFEGKLVPQDPNDEPASLLLERIKKEKATLQTAAKGQKKTKRSEKSKTAQQELI